MGAVLSLFVKEENNEAGIKRQAEGANSPVYALANLSGGGLLYDLSKKAMLTKNYKELDDTIRQKVPPFLYNNGKGKWIHCAHLACLRNRDRPKSKQFEALKQLGDEIFNYRFDGSPLLAKLTEGHSPETHPQYYTLHCWDIECRG
ncbi:uncharacterized protein LOC111700850, partial [Eurytemora carolleeae]|uniref:uncharacterized protein LOC111700850 n=1 Tax=Eurytemora carolleeae TaxID=1294199 RepID=UPI000C78AC23